MIPIRDVNPTTRTPWITLALIAANVVVFLLWQPTLGANSETRTFFFFYCHALVPWEITHQTSLAEGGAAATEAIEGAFALISGSGQAGLLRKSCIFMGVCAAFGTGAAMGAFLTERVPAFTLVVPVIALLLVVLLCRTSRPIEAGQV